MRIRFSLADCTNWFFASLCEFLTLGYEAMLIAVTTLHVPKTRNPTRQAIRKHRLQAIPVHSSKVASLVPRCCTYLRRQFLWSRASTSGAAGDTPAQLTNSRPSQTESLLKRHALLEPLRLLLNFTSSVRCVNVFIPTQDACETSDISSRGVKDHSSTTNRAFGATMLCCLCPAGHHGSYIIVQLDGRCLRPASPNTSAGSGIA